MFRAAVVSAVLLSVPVAPDALAHDMTHHAADAAGPDVAAIPGLPGFGGPFSLVDHAGRPRTDADFRGKLMLVTFGYTDCPDICPLDLQKVTDALNRVGPDVVARVAPLFITVDPKHDTPERLAAFVASFSPTIIGLTGRPDQIADVAKAYRIHALVEPDGTIEHSDFQYLMGPDGKFLTLIRPDATAEVIADLLNKYAKAALPRGS
jgi:protein SCO1/2